MRFIERQGAEKALRRGAMLNDHTLLLSWHNEPRRSASSPSSSETFRSHSGLDTALPSGVARQDEEAQPDVGEVEYYDEDDEDNDESHEDSAQERGICQNQSMADEESAVIYDDDDGDDAGEGGV